MNFTKRHLKTCRTLLSLSQKKNMKHLKPLDCIFCKIQKTEVILLLFLIGLKAYTWESFHFWNCTLARNTNLVYFCTTNIWVIFIETVRLWTHELKKGGWDRWVSRFFVLSLFLFSFSAQKQKSINDYSFMKLWTNCNYYKLFF